MPIFVVPPGVTALLAEPTGNAMICPAVVARIFGEPWVLGRSVVKHQVNNYFDLKLVCSFDKLLELPHGADVKIDAHIIGDAVTVTLR